MKILMVVSLAFLFVSCHSSDFREDKVFAGGIKVSAADLNKGKDT